LIPQWFQCWAVAAKTDPWGEVIAIEAQERVFYALAGNIAINNCFNARAVHAAVAAEVGTMNIPSSNYLRPGSFGSLELKPRDGTEFIGQPIDYSEATACEIDGITIDSLELARIDLIKIDVEGMEIEALAGAAGSLARAHPILIVEMIKSDKARLGETLRAYGYRLFEMGLNLLAVHESDQTLTHVKPT
jgi:FkbM family methyltransferase